MRKDRKHGKHIGRDSIRAVRWVRTPKHEIEIAHAAGRWIGSWCEIIVTHDDPPIDESCCMVIDGRKRTTEYYSNVREESPDA